MTSAAIVLTHDRPRMLLDCVQAIRPQVDRVLVMAHNCTAYPVLPPDPGVTIAEVHGGAPNIGAMWLSAIQTLQPLGIDYAAFLCDDTAPAPEWFQSVVSAMRSTGATAGSTHQLEPTPYYVLKTAPDGDVIGRMCGWAFVLDLRVGVQPDPNLHWWWNDTDIDFQARQRGGMVIAPGPVVPNRLPNDYTVSRGYWDRVELDRQAFVRKWGFQPW